MGRSRLLARVVGVELFFTGLLILVSVVIAWFSLYVVYRLFKG
jgi:hypothetical protein